MSTIKKFSKRGIENAIKLCKVDWKISIYVYIYIWFHYPPVWWPNRAILFFVLFLIHRSFFSQFSPFCQLLFLISFNFLFFYFILSDFSCFLFNFLSFFHIYYFILLSISLVFLSILFFILFLGQKYFSSFHII